MDDNTLMLWIQENKPEPEEVHPLTQRVHCMRGGIREKGLAMLRPKVNTPQIASSGACKAVILPAKDE